MALSMGLNTPDLNAKTAKRQRTTACDCPADTARFEEES